MTVPILFGTDCVTLPSARIARGDVRSFRDAGELLAAARAIRDDAQAAHDAARKQGYAAGRQAALDEFTTALGDALAQLGAGFAEENARREQEVGAAAIAVVEQLIGAHPAEDVVAGLAAQALRKANAGSDACIVEVAAGIADGVRQRLGESFGPVQISPRPDLSRLACRVTTSEGRIIADLDTQLASLRQRWGVDQSGQAPQ
jgi:flagellar biosynthesis/type III secretory pathway protein FliH